MTFDETVSCQPLSVRRLKLGNSIKASAGLGLMTLSWTAFAQTATPSVLPPAPALQSTIDRSGIDRVMGIISDVNFESAPIGNKFSGLRSGYDSSGASIHSAYLSIERASIYNGGVMAARVAARGSVHVFILGTISQTTQPVPPPGSGDVAWLYSPLGGSTFTDQNDDGAILSCSGPDQQMFRGGTCSIYLATDGSRTDFRMPTTQYDLNLRNWTQGYPTKDHVAYAWPTMSVLADGEELTYSYVNYAEYDWPTGQLPPPTKWNAVDSSLGFRVYLSGATPSNTSNPGSKAPPLQLITTGGSLHAINLSQEYADPLTLNRSFSSGSLSSVRSAVSGGSTLINSGVPIATTVQSSQGVEITKPNGGLTLYSGAVLPPYTSNWGATPTSLNSPSTPYGAFPRLSFGAVRHAQTTSYSITFDRTNYVPERYFGSVSNPDGSSESFVVQYGLLQSQTDGLGRTTTLNWSGQEGYLLGIPGYARLARLSGIVQPGGNSISYGYTHGAVSNVTINPAGGGTALTTTIGLVTTCTMSNYRVCNKPVYIRDARNNQTDFTYDPAHGGLLTETKPADQSGVRPQRRFSYTQLYPKRLNSSGQLTNWSAVWRLTRESECLSATSANPASCVGTAQEKVTTYAYNSNNLFLTSLTTALGDGSQSRTTSYVYNYAGDVTETDGPRTDVDDRSYTTYDVLRRKIFEIGPDSDGTGALKRLIVRHTYDADGNETVTETGSGIATDGSDFVASRRTRRTFDLYGKVLKVEEVQP